MSETRDTSPVSFGEFAVLADNYQWSGLDAESASRFEDLIARNQFPLYPDTMFIIMCRSGSFTITSGGETVEARPRDAIVTLGGQPVEGVEISPDCRLVFFSGKSRYFNTQIDLDDANRILRHALEVRHPFLLHLTVKEFHAVEKLFFSAKELLPLVAEDAKNRLVSGYARIISTLIAMHIKHQQQEDDDIVSTGNRTLLTDFLDNVRTNCRNHREIAFYSGLANLTPKYFSRQIKRLSGKSPGAIIEEYTIAEAKQLLVSKKYSVKEISNLLNFASPSSFCKYFKSAEGISPGQYMEQN